MSGAGRPFPSDRFVRSAVYEEPRDGPNFFDGAVEPGGAVAMTSIVTATGPTPGFHVPRRPNSPPALPADVP